MMPASFFWVIPETQYVITVVFFLLCDSLVPEIYVPPLSTTYEQQECSETSAHKIQMLENHPKERIQHSEHGKNMKSRHNYLIT